MAFSDPFLREYYGAAASARQPLSRLFDQHFGLTLNNEDILPSVASLRPHAFSSTLRPRRLFTRQQSGVSEVQNEKERFQVMLDVQQFTPRELNVKTIDNFIVIEGKHEEREDEHGFISRQFVRRYAIPEDVKPDNVECNLSSDGVLLISAKRTVQQTEPTERPVFIHQTHLPAINKKEQVAPSTDSGKTSSASATPASNGSATTGATASGPTEGRRIEVQLTD